MTRTRQQTFSPNRANMEKLAEIRPKDIEPGSRVSSQVWDITIRDWQRSVGRKLSRGFANKSKIEKTLRGMSRAYSSKINTPEFNSAQAVLQLALGNTKTALEGQRAKLRPTLIRHYITNVSLTCCSTWAKLILGCITLKRRQK
jgi:hypothetical protein